MSELREEWGAAECIMERQRYGGEIVKVWHLARPGGDSWWRGIACSDDEGIVAPGSGYDRVPTCSKCLILYENECGV